MSEMNTKTATIGKGSVLVVLQVNAAAGTDLIKLRNLLPGQIEHGQLIINRRMPTGFGFDPPPVRVKMAMAFPPLNSRSPDQEIEVTFYETGIVEFCVTYPLDGATLDSLPALSSAILQEKAIEEWQRKRASWLFERFGSAFIEPMAPEETAWDDLVFWRIRSLADKTTSGDNVPSTESHTGVSAGEVNWQARMKPYLALMAQVTHGETKPLSTQRIAKTVADMHWNSYYAADSICTSYYGAWIFGEEEDPDISDVYAAILAMGLEFRTVDESLDDDLKQAAQMLRGRPLHTWWRLRGASRRAMRRYLHLTQRFSAVDSALNLTGDQYLQEVAEMALRDLRVRDMQQSVQRKLTSFYEVVSTLRGERQTSDMNMMELLIILLFVMSNAISLVALGWWPSSIFGWSPIKK